MKTISGTKLIYEGGPGEVIRFFGKHIVVCHPDREPFLMDMAGNRLAIEIDPHMEIPMYFQERYIRA